MDYTPIGVGRVLIAFVLTIVVGALPVLAVLLNGNFATSDAPDGYGVMVLGLGSIALAVLLIGLSRLAFAARRRVVGQPSRA